MFSFLIFFMFVVIVDVRANDVKGKLYTDLVNDVCIVGAGIGGASTAYYMFQRNSSTTVRAFERRDYVGGRLKHVVIEGNVIEIGGDAWSSANEYIGRIVKDLNVSVDEDASRLPQDPVSDSLAVWNGETLIGVEETLLKHALSDVKGLLEEAEFLRALRRNYRERGADPFQTIDEFLTFGDLTTYTKVSSSEYFDRHLIANATQRDLVEPLLRTIYDQGLDAHAFASLVAVTSVVGAASASEGNSALVEAMFNASAATVELRTNVKSVERFQNGTFLLRTDASGVSGTHHCRTIALASPIEFCDVRFVGDLGHEMDRISRRPFEHNYVHLVTAKAVNGSYFGHAGARVPDTVLTTRDATSTPFVDVQLVASLSGNRSLYKLFANQLIPSTDLRRIFVNMSNVSVHRWTYTFPHLRPQNEGGYQPIEPAVGLVYLNAMESVASAMEGSVIAGRNAAGLLYGVLNS